MNYFFFVSKDDCNARLEIPKFQNQGKVDSQLRLFSADIIDETWSIGRVECNQDSNFFYVDSNEDNCHSIYFLASLSQVGGESTRAEKLIQYNDFSTTVPDFRANLCVSNSAGGFSSYQSDYPYDMTLRRGSIMTSVSTLSNPILSENTLFIRNIFCEPKVEQYSAYLVCKKTKKVINNYSLLSNRTNQIRLSIEDINPNYYIISKGFLGVPIYYCESNNGHISVEHTHPPHSNTHGPQRYAHEKKKKNELLEIVN